MHQVEPITQQGAHMRIRTQLPILAVILIGVLGAQTKPAIKHVPLSPTSPASGKEMFATYCAVCHGVDGRGAGPAAAALKNRPTDLTQLAAKKGGKYPGFLVTETLSGKAIAAHGSKEMPVWGDLFRALESGDNSFIQLRLVNLTSYVESIQAK